MALIKKSEFTSMNTEQLHTKLGELKKEMIKLNMQRSTGTTPENPGRIKLIKKTIARIYTVATIKKAAAKKKPEVKKTVEKKIEKKVAKKAVKKIHNQSKTKRGGGKKTKI